MARHPPKRRKKQAKPAREAPPELEALEPRVLLSTFTVAPIEPAERANEQPWTLPVGRSPADDPAAALAAALSSGGPLSAVVAVAVDHPFVRLETLQELVFEFAGKAVVPVENDVRQVTCAVYPAAWTAAAGHELEAGGSLQSLLDRMPHREVTRADWSAWGEDGRSWFSVDDEAALADGLARFGSAFQ